MFDNATAATQVFALLALVMEVCVSQQLTARKQLVSPAAIPGILLAEKKKSPGWNVKSLLPFTLFFYILTQNPHCALLWSKTSHGGEHAYMYVAQSVQQRFLIVIYSYLLDALVSQG